MRDHDYSSGSVETVDHLSHLPKPVQWEDY